MKWNLLFKHPGFYCIKNWCVSSEYSSLGAFELMLANQLPLCRRLICKCQPAFISNSLKWVFSFVSEVQFQKLMQLSIICISSGQVKIHLVDFSVSGFSPRGSTLVFFFKLRALWAKQLCLNSCLSWLGSMASHRMEVNVDFSPSGLWH